MCGSSDIKLVSFQLMACTLTALPLVGWEREQSGATRSGCHVMWHGTAIDCRPQAGSLCASTLFIQHSVRVTHSWNSRRDHCMLKQNLHQSSAILNSKQICSCDSLILHMFDSPLRPPDLKVGSEGCDTWKSVCWFVFCLVVNHCWLRLKFRQSKFV